MSKNTFFGPKFGSENMFKSFQVWMKNSIRGNWVKQKIHHFQFQWPKMSQVWSFVSVRMSKNGQVSSIQAFIWIWGARPHLHTCPSICNLPCSTGCTICFTCPPLQFILSSLVPGDLPLSCCHAPLRPSPDRSLNSHSSHLLETLSNLNEDVVHASEPILVCLFSKPGWPGDHIVSAQHSVLG